MTKKPTYKYRGTTGLFAQPIGKGLNQTHNELFDKSTLELIRLGTHWPEIAGEAADTSRPVKLNYAKNGANLHISASASSALELQHMQPVLIQRIAKILGHRKVNRISLMQT